MNVQSVNLMLTSKLTKWRLFSPRMQNHCSLMKKSTMKHLCYEVMQKLTTEDVSTEACSRRQAPLIKKPTMKHLYNKDKHETSLVRRHEKNLSQEIYLLKCAAEDRHHW